MKYLGLLLLVAYVAAGDKCNCQFSFPGGSYAGSSGVNTRLDAQTLRLGRLEQTIGNLEKKFSSSDSEYAEAVETLDYLNDQVESIRPKKCPEGEVECLDNGDCVDQLLVCDGVKDCFDNSDEQERVCTLPITVGDEFKGQLLSGNECLDGGFKSDVTVSITSITKLPWFPQRPKIGGRVVYRYSDGGTETAGSFKVSGYYNAAVATLSLSATDASDDIGLSAKFGAYNNNKAVATLNKIQKSGNRRYEAML
ncbi:unnamed protein product [Owenia fusiformis]|uniref:Annelid erythrocruorin linker subunit C-terminal domain-containing protein n=1 Tax=Owenia fusiformis TaxID=6347 RepID=A0A8S4P1M1_OWEFU|nr:unnamed protein product [Owenia fusiformis]